MGAIHNKNVSSQRLNRKNFSFKKTITFMKIQNYQLFSLSVYTFLGTVLFCLFSSSLTSQCLNSDVTTLAGSAQGFVNVDGQSARFDNPVGVAVDAAGNVYIADAFNHTIRKITPGGSITTFAGSGSPGFTDGTGTAAQFNNPVDIDFDASGDLIVADALNHSIRKITPAGVVTTIAGTGTAGTAEGTGATAQFDTPYGVAADGSGNIYVADYNNFRIRRITSTNVVSTLAGSIKGYADGTGAAALFDGPISLDIDPLGKIFVADAFNNRIREVTAGGVVTTYAGTGGNGSLDGARTMATFNNPTGITADAAGNLLISDGLNHSIRKINSVGVVSTLARGGGSGFMDGMGSTAKFLLPSGIAHNASGVLFVSDSGNHSIREISTLGVVTTLAGSQQGFINGSAAAAKFNSPLGVAIDAQNNAYIADAANHVIRKITPNGDVTTYAGTGSSGFVDGIGSIAQFNSPSAIAIDAAGVLYVADLLNHSIRKIESGGMTTTIAGNGSSDYIDANGTSARFSFPSGIALDNQGNLYVTDLGNNRIRKISPTGDVNTLAGNGMTGHVDGPALSAQFNNPTGIATDNSGNVIIADAINHRIRKISTSGIVSTIAGNGSAGPVDGDPSTAEFNSPSGVAVDIIGTIYVADALNNRIRIITTNGEVKTLAGSGNGGILDGQSSIAEFEGPAAIAVDVFGNSFIADALNHRIRKIGNCTVRLDAQDIPTLGQWGVLILLLIMLNFGIIAIQTSQKAI